MIAGWDEGLVGKVHDSRSLSHFGGDVVWNTRAGGDDEALNAGAKNDANTSSVWGSGGGAATGTATLGQYANLGTTTGWIHRAELKHRGVVSVAGATYDRIDDEGLHITVGGEQRLVPADTVVLYDSDFNPQACPGEHATGHSLRLSQTLPGAFLL